MGEIGQNKTIKSKNSKAPTAKFMGCTVCCIGEVFSLATLISQKRCILDDLNNSRQNMLNMEALIYQASRSPSCDVGARPEPRRRPTVEAPQLPQVLDTRVRTCAAARTQAAPGSSTSSPQVVMIGSSLVRDQGKLLQRQGINCTCYTYSGAVLPFIKNRVPNILTEQCQPEYVHLMCGGNDLDNHNVDEVCQAYERLICEVKRCSPYSTVVVNTIPPRRKKWSKTVWKDTPV